MAQVEVDGDGIYHASKTALVLSTRRELPGAVPPCKDFVAIHPYGWISGGIPAPSKHDRYIVEFLGKSEFRILAYIDGFARVFATDRPVTRPPATEPSLSLAQYPEQEPGEVARGIIQILCPDKVTRRAAEYRVAQGAYSTMGSWFDFGAAGQDVVLEELLTRAYLAFVYRPSLCGIKPPLFGIGNVESLLSQEKPLDAMDSIYEAITEADADPALVVPGIEQCLARWLREAGLGSDRMRALRQATKTHALHLVRTIKYADMFYLGSNNEEPKSTQRKTVWALEAALNRFLLVAEALGDRARFASESECAQWDYYVLETIAQRMPAAETPVDSLEHPAGEWAVRYGMAGAFERLRLPYRFTNDFRVNVADGCAAIDMVVPDASLMPETSWPEQVGGWMVVSPEEREVQADRYGRRLAVMVAAIAFNQSHALKQVSVSIRPVIDGAGVTDSAGEFPWEHDAFRSAVMRFERTAFCEGGAYRAAALGDPAAFVARFEVDKDLEIKPSPLKDEQLSPKWRMIAPEVSDRLLSDQAKSSLGIEDISELSVNYDAARRHIAENLADSIVQAGNTSERIKLVSAVKEESGDPLVEEGCTRLMVALTDGSIDATDQNIIVNSFLGEDALIAALAKAQGLAQDDPNAAITVLVDAIASADFTRAFSDNGNAISRCFDSYATRVLYNLARRDGLLPREAGKPVQLVTDSLYFCCLEAVKLLERSFDRTEDALRYGKRCIELAPMSGPGYLQTARAYMLVGDMDHTIATINDYLRIAVLANEISVAYYQLAYAEWKADRARVATAAYLKSMSVSPVVYEQSKLELEELLRESKSDLIPSAQIDAVLEEGGVRVAPSDTLLDRLLEASAAAVDAELFVVARSALSAYGQFRPDDAVMSVLRSLGD